MPRPDARDRTGRDVASPGGHVRFPVFVILIINTQGHRTAQRFPAPHPREDFDGIRLDFLPGAPARPALAERKVRIDGPDVHHKVRGQPFNDGNQRFSMGFPRRRQFHYEPPSRPDFAAELSRFRPICPARPRRETDRFRPVFSLSILPQNSQKVKSFIGFFPD